MADLKSIGPQNLRESAALALLHLRTELSHWNRCMRCCEPSPMGESHRLARLA